MTHDKLGSHRDDSLAASLISDFTLEGFISGPKLSSLKHTKEDIPVKNHLLKCEVTDDRFAFGNQNIHSKNDINNTVGLSETTLKRLRLFNDSLVILDLPRRRQCSGGATKDACNSVRSSKCSRIARVQLVSCEDDVMVMMPSLWFNLMNMSDHRHIFEEKVATIQVEYKGSRCTISRRDLCSVLFVFFLIINLK